MTTESIIEEFSVAEKSGLKSISQVFDRLFDNENCSTDEQCIMLKALGKKVWEHENGGNAEFKRTYTRLYMSLSNYLRMH